MAKVNGKMVAGEVGNKVGGKTVCARACKKENMAWRCVEDSVRYQRAVAREMSHRTALKIETEVLDGIFLNLNERSRWKSSNVQNRILRRVVGKRQAQARHRKIGRADNLASAYYVTLGTSECLTAINRKRRAA